MFENDVVGKVGVARCVVLEDFNPEVFRELHPVYEHETDRACHALWVKHHRFDLPACTEEHLLKSLHLQLTVYPTGFPWEAYTRLHPEAGRNRWAALEHFLHHGFDHIGLSLSYKEGAGVFLFAVGQHYANRDDRLAIRAFELALGEPDVPADLKKWLADAYLRHQIWHRSRALHGELIDDMVAGREGPDGRRPPRSGVSPVSASTQQTNYLADVVRSFVDASNRLDRWELFFERLSPLLQHEQGVRDLPLEICSAHFDRRSGAARQYYFTGAKPAGDKVMATAIDSVSKFLSLMSDGKPQSESTPQAQVLILVDSLEDRSIKQRLDQHKSALQALEFTTKVFTLEQIDAFRGSLAGARAAILVSLAAWPHVIEAISAARAAEVATFYEIDDLIMDEDHSPQPLAHFDGLLGRDVYTDLLFGAAMHRGVASLCDYGIASTDALAARLAQLVRKARCFTIRPSGWENSSEGKPAAGDGVTKQDAFTFFFRSLRAYVFDQREPAGAALLELLGLRDDFRVVVQGYSQLGKEFDRFRSRFTRLGVDREHRSVLATCHVNIALDAGGELGACAPERSWLEAAQLGVPTIASSTKAYRERLLGGFDVLLVQTAAEWRQAMELLIDNPGRRAEIAAAACARAQAAYAPAEALPSYRAAFIEPIPSR